MISTGLIALLAAAQASTTSLSVGATVVRPEPPAVIGAAGAAVTVRNAGRATVAADGGTAKRTNDGTILITPDSAGRLTITLTY